MSTLTRIRRGAGCMIAAFALFLLLALASSSLSGVSALSIHKHSYLHGIRQSPPAWPLAPAVPGAAPVAGAPAGAPAAAEEEPELAPALPCNWTVNDYGVAAPVSCSHHSVDDVTVGNETSSKLIYTCEPYVPPPEPVECEEADEECAAEAEAEKTAAENQDKTGEATTTGTATAERKPPINPRDGWPDTCEPPLLLDCPVLPNLNMVSQYYEALGNDAEDVGHGVRRIVRCAEGASPTSAEYDVSTWGEDWYPGWRETFSHCANGTWTNVKSVNMAVSRPQEISCFTDEQIRELKNMIHYWKLSVERYNITMNITWDNPETPIVWIDSTASLRKWTLEHAHKSWQKLYDDAMGGEMAPAADFKTVTNWMIDNRMNPVGLPHSEKTCKDLNTHVLHKSDGEKLVPSPDISCNYVRQKSAIGYDYMTASAVFLYRDGCQCDSRWAMGCPWEVDQQPSYATFGFAAMDKKEINTGMGAKLNYVCWYWSDPVHPESGYDMGIERGRYEYHNVA